MIIAAFLIFVFTLEIFAVKFGNNEIELSFSTEGYKNSTTADSISATLNEGLFYIQEIGGKYKTKLLGFNLITGLSIRFTNDDLYDNKFELNNIYGKIQKRSFFIEGGKIYANTTRNGFNYSLTGIKSSIRTKFGSFEIFGGNIWSGKDSYRYNRWGAGGKYYLRIKNRFSLMLFGDTFSDFGTFTNIPSQYEKITKGLNGGGEMSFNFLGFNLKANGLYTISTGDINGNLKGYATYGRLGKRLGPIDIKFEAGYMDDQYVSPTRLGIANNNFINFSTKYFSEKSTFEISSNFRQYFDTYRNTDYFSTVVNLSFSKRKKNKKTRFSNYFTIKHTGDGLYSMFGDQLNYYTEIPLNKLIYIEPDMGISYEKEKVSGMSDNASINLVYYLNMRLLQKKNNNMNIRFGLNGRYGYYFNSKISSYNILPVGRVNWNLKRFYFNVSSNYLPSILNRSACDSFHLDGNTGYYIDKNMTKSIGLLGLFMNDNYKDVNLTDKTEYQIKLQLSFYF